jgi:mannose/cellobiose epimerase-like protein (N-acyl-D-glucosamine 2-epimerase family)
MLRLNRRQFLASAAGAGVLATAETTLAGMSLRDLRQHYHRELFDEVLPFWDKHGIDHQRGGFMCSLADDGTLIDTNKHHWFQGRGIWVYSYLYNQFGRDPRFLAIAGKAKDFLLAHFPQKDGWWAELVSREGRVLKPFGQDLYGMYFGAEGLQEFAQATGDDQARDLAFRIVKKLFAHLQRPDFQDRAGGKPGVRTQGLWMANLQICTQILRRWNDPEIARIADYSLNAILNKHYNPEIGLNTEVLNVDFSRPREEATRSVLGHSLECLWMAFDEALRRKDAALARTCAERIRHHLDVGWDHVYGGLAEAVNVGQDCFEWPVDRLEGTHVEFRMRGEYNYRKTFWAINEVLVAAMKVFEQTGAEWAARYFGLAQTVADTMFKRKQPGAYMLVSDRKMTLRTQANRQDNYHPLRRLMYIHLALDRRLAARGGLQPAAAGL